MVNPIEERRGIGSVVLPSHEGNLPRDPIQEKNPGASSIQPAGVHTKYVPTKPSLERPNPLWSALEQVQHLEEVTDKLGLRKEEQVNALLAKNRAQQIEQSRVMQEATNYAREVTFWGILEDMSSLVMSGVSTAFGFSAFAAGNPVVGGILVTSGIISVANVAFKHGEVWDYVATRVAGENATLREGIKTYLPTAIGIACAASCVYGSYSMLSAEVAVKSNLLTAFETFSGISQGLSMGIGGVMGSQLQRKQAGVSHLQSKIRLTTIDVELVAEELIQMQKHQKRIMGQMSQLVREQEQAVQTIHQPA